jgi:hypothetical protein
VKTTYRKLIEHNPCAKSVNKMLEYNNLEPIENLSDLDPSIDLGTEISLKEILDICGIQDAVWCLQAFPYRDYCLFLADVAELSLPIFEDRYPNDTRVRDCIDAIRKWHANEIDNVALNAARDAARAAACAAARAAASDAAWDAANAAVNAVAWRWSAEHSTAFDAAFDAANAAARAVASAVASAVAWAAAWDAAWERIKEIFEKYYV